MTTVKELTRQEIAELSRDWLAHFDTLEGKVLPDFLDIARSAVQPDNFGWGGWGQLRPDADLARYDMYALLAPGPGSPDAHLISRLTARELAQAMADDDPSAIADEALDELDELLGDEAYALHLALLELRMAQMGIPQR